jgi:hypothetical protein
MAIRMKAIITRMNFLPARLIRTLPVAANRVFDPAQEGSPVAVRFGLTRARWPTGAAGKDEAPQRGDYRLSGEARLRGTIQLSA